MTYKKPELLIPASSLEVLKTAVIFGADAVYIGGEAFGLRAKAKNFSKEDMKEYLEDTKGNFVGIGIYMVKNTSKDRIEVLSPIKNSPAEKARN